MSVRKRVRLRAQQQGASRGGICSKKELQLFSSNKGSGLLAPPRLISVDNQNRLYLECYTR